MFTEEGLDLAFWFTFAGYRNTVSADPRHDLDLASYGLVSMLPEGPGSGYQGPGLAPPGWPSGPWPGSPQADKPPLVPDLGADLVTDRRA